MKGISIVRAAPRLRSAAHLQPRCLQSKPFAQTTVSVFSARASPQPKQSTTRWTQRRSLATEATPRTMRAAQWAPEYGKTVRINEVPVPDITENEILVKIASASLCHSDLMLLSGEFPGPGRPVTLGHEAVGYVEKLGANVKNFKPGDRIGFLYIKGCCFECRGCQVHNLNCETGGALLQGFGTDGMFAEYAAVESRNAIILPSNLDMKTSAPIFCAGVTAYHAVDECELKPGDWFAAVGCGGLGQLAIQYAKAMGFKVIGLDINDEILKNAKAAGADHTFNTVTDKNYIEELKAITGGGADATSVFSASHRAYDSAKQILKVMGVLMVIGLPSSDLQFNPIELMRRAYRIKSTSTGPPQQMPPAVEFTAKHNIVPKCSFYKLDQINEMIETMHGGKSVGRLTVVF